MKSKPKKNAFPQDFADILTHVLKHIDERFDRVDDRFAHMDLQFKGVFDRLDRIEFLLAAQERRISTLEDRMRIVATKLGLEFRPQT